MWHRSETPTHTSVWVIFQAMGTQRPISIHNQMTRKREKYPSRKDLAAFFTDKRILPVF
jgi:hypothetical protein